ncbi:type II toxin-antitoxin system RelB family antitoxin [Thiobaca trueperi]|uniref:RHH-type rel operon transcriptional repressor/antitoxin RelB n=1 Tax=Thiobaca trueperi TaxID=127458 RepID=A0A4R3N3Y1_9GAMM|nr:CopG family transcriptional regulator [Thiobaca trueperi]TCT23858.1 RHH-type rel operon transcriptional repressor/antitoxin RelB [Thiobaca trueperi]
MLAVQLPSEFEECLIDLAQAAGQTESDYVLDVLLEHLHDAQALRIAEQRLQDLRDGRSETVPLEQVMRDYGLEN